MDDSKKPKGKLTRNMGPVKGKNGFDDTVAGQATIVSQNMEDDAGFRNPGYSSVRKSNVALKKSYLGDCRLESIDGLDVPEYNRKRNLNDM